MMVPLSVGLVAGLFVGLAMFASGFSFPNALVGFSLTASGVAFLMGLIVAVSAEGDDQ